MIWIDNGYSLLQNIIYLTQGTLSQKRLRFLPFIISPLGLSTQAFQLGILIAFVILSALIIFVNSCNVCVFCKIIFSTKLDLFKATCFIVVSYGCRLFIRLAVDSTFE